LIIRPLKGRKSKETSLITQQLLNWYEEVNAKASDEIKNFKEIIEDHQAKIIPYFKEGKTNAQAENLNKRIQSFIQSNYGVRDKDFFLWRCKQYFS
jgi:transposase